MSVLETIKGSSLFHELYDHEIETIVQQSKVLSLEKGDHIVREGENGNEIFLILSGGAEVKKSGVKLAELGKGDLFGELVLLHDTLRTADIIATTFTDVLVLDYDNIFGLYKSDPKIFSLIILNLARLLTKRLKKAGQNIQELNIKLKALQSQSR